MLNRFWGKFGQRSNMPRIKYISEPVEYFDMLTSDQILVMGIAGFLLHFEEGIHVIGKESSSFRFRIVLFRFIEMPHFVDALNYISPKVLQIYNSTKDSSNAKSFHQEDCTYPYYQ
jgi:hypothetical protein